MEYKIIRSKRKTMGIYVLKDGNVEVRCPNKISNDAIEKFVNSKMNWIHKKASERKNELAAKNEYVLDFNSKLLFMGNEYNIVKSNKVAFDRNCFYTPEINLEQNLLSLYKLLAKDIITEKVLHFSKIMNCTPTNVKINSAKTRWGSCSGKNSLNFTWKLIMAEEKAIDYVIIHELAHIKEHNHSKKFWSIVAHYMPDYRLQQNKLKKLQTKLLITAVL